MLSAVEPPSSSAAELLQPLEKFIFRCYVLLFAFYCPYDEGVPSWQGVDLSLVVTLYGVYVLVFGFRLYFFVCFLPNKQMSSGNSVVILSC